MKCISRQLVRYVYICAGFVMLGSCVFGDQSRYQAKPTALGTSNQIVVIADPDVWDGPAGDTLMFYYASAYPIMPQPEPMFDLKFFTPEQLKADMVRRELRTYLFLADISDPDSPTTRMVAEDLGQESINRARTDTTYFSATGRDRWARGQLLIYLMGNGMEELIEHTIVGFPAIAKRINRHDLEQVDAATYLEGENPKINNKIRDKFDVSLKIPGDYELAIERNNFLWIRRDTREITSSLMITRRPYRSEEQLSREGLIQLRDTLGRYVNTTINGTYMRVNAVDLPVFTYQREIGGNYTIEARGIWEMVGDYLGGPFVSYAIITPDQNTILLVDGFVYAPGKKKRDLIQQIEHIVSSLEFTG